MSNSLNAQSVQSAIIMLSRKLSKETLNTLDQGGEMILNPEAEQKEIASMQEVVMALKNYRVQSYSHIDNCENYINSLPENQQAMLAQYRKNLSKIRDCIEYNQDVINKILRISHHDSKLPDCDGHKVCHNAEVENEKAQSLLKLIARDWSISCAEEREQSYKPIIDAIEEFYPPEDHKPNEIKILVPGAGLGRLTYELALRGYECEGNEFSFFMLIASSFILNHCKVPSTYVLYPWIHQFVNNVNAADQLDSIEFPDICVQKPKGNLHMAAGDFLEVYKEPNEYDCVASCFFIDCANNIIDFIETIHRILVPGGIWVNLGPLLYNYSGIKGENSIEPSYDQLKPIIETIGFEFVRESSVRTRYAQNTKSMLKSEYDSLFWICRKKFGQQNDIY